MTNVLRKVPISAPVPAGYIYQMEVDINVFRKCTIIDKVSIPNPQVYGVLERDQQIRYNKEQNNAYNSGLK